MMPLAQPTAEGNSQTITCPIGAEERSASFYCGDALHYRSAPIKAYIN